MLGHLALLPLILGHRCGWVSSSCIRAAIVRLGFTGIPLAELNAHGRSFALTLPARLRPEALERLR